MANAALFCTDAPLRWEGLSSVCTFFYRRSTSTGPFKTRHAHWHRPIRPLIPPCHVQAWCDIWGRVWRRGLHCEGGGPFCVRGPCYSGPCANILRSALSLLTQQRTRWLCPLVGGVKRAIPNPDDIWCVRQCK